MKSPFFKSKKLELYTHKSYDLYGESEYEYQCTVDADFQPLSPEDSEQVFGEVLSDTYKAYLPLNLTVKPYTIFKIKGEADTYEMKGSPQKWNLFTKHQKIILLKQRTPTALPEVEYKEGD